MIFSPRSKDCFWFCANWGVRLTKCQTQSAGTFSVGVGPRVANGNLASLLNLFTRVWRGTWAPGPDSTTALFGFFHRSPYKISILPPFETWDLHHWKHVAFSTKVKLDTSIYKLQCSGVFPASGSVPRGAFSIRSGDPRDRNRIDLMSIGWAFCQAMRALGPSSWVHEVRFI